LARSSASRQDARKLKELGDNIALVIAKKGYKSAYDFWIHEIGDDISRSALHYVLKGRKDPRYTTLLLIAQKLQVDIKELMP